MRTAAAIHCDPVSWVEVRVIWENWSLVKEFAAHMSPEFPLALVPTAASDEIARPPSWMLVQFGPRLPLARAKLSVALVAPCVVVVHVTDTLVMLAAATVPDPPDTEHVWPCGAVATVTL